MAVEERLRARSTTGSRLFLSERGAPRHAGERSRLVLALSAAAEDPSGSYLTVRCRRVEYWAELDGGELESTGIPGAC